MSHIKPRNNFRKVFAIIQIMEAEIAIVGDINRVIDLNADKSFQGEKR